MTGLYLESTGPSRKAHALTAIVAALCGLVLLSSCGLDSMKGNAPTSAQTPSPTTSPDQALADVQALRTETAKLIGNQAWTPIGGPDLSECRLPDSTTGVRYRVSYKTMDPVDVKAAVEKVKALWESKGFSTDIPDRPGTPELTSLFGTGINKREIEFRNNKDRTFLSMDSECVPGSFNDIAMKMPLPDHAG
ncbi:hypothetical protein [Arthrobacter bambusae]|uniref:Uncharacterized protein n=1 Tax=Arthrobacter bambusae TaxID=1338426 RepID=A0AAW8DH44_9MICC|nr:hypothetical protein [Arthrobacter bambusae]MDP9904705.1 hypothetical protein [Arthrobacter bambusae]MDQ0129521.1 hypothetical protein [Arthrobacter bambusae]MDQ0180866.1 hypothetical protein [Arthrobacter bambusae]